MNSGTGRGFPATRYSVIDSLRADSESERAAALERVAAAYWPAVYGYLRRRGQNRTEAEDLTQGFFARVLEKDDLARYDAKRAKFRTWIRLLLDRYVASDLEARSRQKRGGHLARLSLDFDGAERQLGLTDPARGPEELFDREWARSLFRLAIDRLERDLVADGRESDFRIFERYDLDAPASGEAPTYRSLGEEFGLSESQITNLLHRVRARLRSTLESVLAEITGSPAEARAELEELFGGAS